MVVLPPGAPAVLDLLEDLVRASLLGTVTLPDLEDELRFQHYVFRRRRDDVPA
mgnify:CR=1 FL=1